MRRGRYILLILLAMVPAGRAALAAERLWPVPLAPAVSSNFCEYREGRFHGGIDVRTGGREGVACRAAAAGWVSRIRAGSLGYGKALHVTFEDGDEAVYAHLAEFMPALEDSLAAAQAWRGRYNVDVHLSPGAVRVARGDIIAYSGQTGAAAPHLHFEVRENDVAVNPFRKGFAVPDQRLPSISRIALVPLAPTARVEGLCLPLELIPRRLAPGRYVVDDTLHVTGAVGVAATVVDYLNRASGRLAPYRMQVFAGSTPVSVIMLDRFPFAESGQVDLLYHAGATRARGQALFDLYRRDGETLEGRTFARGGSITPPTAGAGHDVTVAALDVAGNRAEVTLHVVSATHPGGRPDAAPRAPNLTDGLDGAYFGDGFAVMPVPGPRRMMKTRAGEVEPGDTLSLRAVDLVDRVTVIARGGALDTATVYVTGFKQGVMGGIGFPALGVSLTVPDNALYGDAVVYATRANTGEARMGGGLSLQSTPVRIGPAGWVLHRAVTVSLEYDGDDPRDAVFRWDDRRRSWSFLASERADGAMSASSGRPGVFAVVRDEAPPWLGAPQLDRPRSYFTGQATIEVRVPVEDKGSGVDDRSIRVTIGGDEHFARWDFAKKKIVVGVRGDSIIGPQPVHVIVSDKCGNETAIEATIDFGPR
jgi:hypothetical protein